MPEAIKAPLVLTVICAIISAALAFANSATKDTIAQAEEDRLRESLTEAFGEGEYNALAIEIDGVNQVIKDEKGRVIFDITSSGYEKDGQRLLIGLDENGAVSGVKVVSIEDSPTQAAKVQEESFLSQFEGRAEPQDSYDAISGATKSSGGIQSGVNLALAAYAENREAIENG